jgi:hypothetical protein
MLALEANSVVGLPLKKIAYGGVEAGHEVILMVREKLDAAAEAYATLSGAIAAAGRAPSIASAEGSRQRVQLASSPSDFAPPPRSLPSTQGVSLDGSRGAVLAIRCQCPNAPALAPSHEMACLKDLCAHRTQCLTTAIYPIIARKLSVTLSS